jgi:hypothetical protein
LNRRAAAVSFRLLLAVDGPELHEAARHEGSQGQRQQRGNAPSSRFHQTHILSLRRLSSAPAGGLSPPPANASGKEKKRKMKRAK